MDEYHSLKKEIESLQSNQMSIIHQKINKASQRTKKGTKRSIEEEDKEKMGVSVDDIELDFKPSSKLSRKKGGSKRKTKTRRKKRTYK